MSSNKNSTVPRPTCRTLREAATTSSSPAVTSPPPGRGRGLLPSWPNTHGHQQLRDQASLSSSPLNWVEPLLRSEGGCIGGWASTASKQHVPLFRVPAFSERRSGALSETLGAGQIRDSCWTEGWKEPSLEQSPAKVKSRSHACITWARGEPDAGVQAGGLRVLANEESSCGSRRNQLSRLDKWLELPTGPPEPIPRPLLPLCLPQPRNAWSPRARGEGRTSRGEVQCIPSRTVNHAE